LCQKIPDFAPLRARESLNISTFALMSTFRFADAILYEDDHYLVVNKPPFIATLEDRSSPLNMLALAREYAHDAQACHRIDKETSGALAFAKTPEAYRHLAIQFETRKVEKLYHAVIDGVKDFKNNMVSEPIMALKTGVVKIDRKDGKEAITHFDTIKAYRHHTLVACRPLTGRMHQIRIHLAHLGASIVCDEQYGGKAFFLSQIKKNFKLKKFTDEEPLIRRFALHAYALGFENVDGTPLRIVAPYPKDFQVLVKQLEKNV
jgi:RluA family pseudouridine synthase